jgi:hypothetical protein
MRGMAQTEIQIIELIISDERTVIVMHKVAVSVNLYYVACGICIKLEGFVLGVEFNRHWKSPFRKILLEILYHINGDFSI